MSANAASFILIFQMRKRDAKRLTELGQLESGRVFYRSASSLKKDLTQLFEN